MEISELEKREDASRAIDKRIEELLKDQSNAGKAYTAVEIARSIYYSMGADPITRESPEFFILSPVYDALRRLEKEGRIHGKVIVSKSEPESEWPVKYYSVAMV